MRIVLALTLGLATTTHAQDWSVDSRTRVNSTEDATSTEQRVRTAVDFGVANLCLTWNSLTLR